MNKTYQLFQSNRALERVEEFKDYFDVLLKQTIECAYFIQKYSSHGFGVLQTYLDNTSIYIVAVTRAIEGVFLSPDDTIDAYKEKFDQLSNDFKGQATLSTTIVVHRILDEVSNIGQLRTGLYLLNS